ncbi:putative gustatory receptor clone PTE03 [Lampris incognitus]|uniref:putative gustatory receptor clone PTE03 n=1 Tax=Lampris incognitus TaxID=2546036 RepID=UPI0024B48675|nr:putative gustatory receptor clone PTE03 [Lampris incognitus]
MENQTFSDVLLLEGLNVTSQSFFPTFIFLIIIYIFTVVSNIGLVALIFQERRLHQPMYLLFCNMSINDILGATTIIPRLLSDIFKVSTERYITYIECVIQAFCFHLHIGTSLSVLMAMAFDRYVAICNPLRYATIMTNRMVLILTVLAWGVIFVMVAVLVGLTIPLSRCRWFISHPFCDNASLFKLSCQNVLSNNIYGLCYTVILLGSSIGSTTLTYLKIALVCLTSKSKVLNSRALQTCATHLAAYVIMLVSGATFVVLHRFPQLSDQRKLASMIIMVIPPAVNAIIYGLQIKELRQKIIATFYRNKVALMDF